MTIPAEFETLIQARDAKFGRWIEIEGLPYAYGNFSASSGFFTDVVFDGIKPYLQKIPRMISQSIDVLRGGAESKGEVSFHLVDVDQSLEQWAGIGYSTGFVSLFAELTNDPGDNEIHYVGDASAFTNGGLLYIGNETIRIGTKAGATLPGSSGSFTGCTRGLFRSRPVAWGVGVPIGTRAYTMASRRCWYNQIGSTDESASLAAVGDEFKCVRFSGVISNLIRDDQPSVWQLTCHTMDEEMDRPCFRRFRSFELEEQIFGPDDDQEKAEDGGISSFPRICSWRLPAGLFENNEELMFRIDDEIFYGKIAAWVSGGETYQTLELTARAQLGSQDAHHEKGAIVREVISIVSYANVAGFEKTSLFTATPDATNSGGAKGDHPLALILQVLLSTGFVDGDAITQNSDYDVLPADFGMGIEQERVDVEGIELLMAEDPELRFGSIIDEPTNFVSWMREILTFAGYYYYIETGDIFRVKRLKPPAPDTEAQLREIDDSARIRKTPATWEANWTGAIREVTFKYGLDIMSGKFKRIEIFKLAEPDLYSKGLARSIEFTCRWVYPGKTGIPGEPPFARFDVSQWLLTRAEFFKTRYGRPPPIIHEHLKYEFMDIEVGELVAITNPNLPSGVTGARGISEEIGEIISKQIDDESKTVDVTVLMTGYVLGNYRFVAPSLKVFSVLVAADPDFTVAVHSSEFTDAVVAGVDTQRDWLLLGSDGETRNAFPDGVKVTLWEEDFSDSQAGVLTIVDADAGEFKFTSDDSPPAFTPAAGQFITYSAFADVFAETDGSAANEELGETYAFAAESDGTLDDGASGAEGHALFPT